MRIALALLGVASCSGGQGGDGDGTALTCGPGTLTLSGTLDGEPISVQEADYEVDLAVRADPSSWRVDVSTSSPVTSLSLAFHQGTLTGAVATSSAFFISGSGSQVIAGAYPDQVRFSLRNMVHPAAGGCGDGGSCAPGFACLPDGRCCDDTGKCAGAGSGSLDGCLGAQP